MTVLADRIGDENAQLVIAAAGGTRVSVPAQLDQGKRHAFLIEKFGERLGILLILHFGGSTIYIPSGRPRFVKRPDVKASDVMRLTRKGKSASQIAKMLGCSDRTVYAKRDNARLSAKRREPTP